LASLLETDEEKEREKGTTDADGGEVGSDEELEYFPGRDMMAEQGADNLHTLVTAVSESTGQCKWRISRVTQRSTARPNQFTAATVCM